MVVKCSPEAARDNGQEARVGLLVRLPTEELGQRRLEVKRLFEHLLIEVKHWCLVSKVYFEELGFLLRFLLVLRQINLHLLFLKASLYTRGAFSFG